MKFLILLFGLFVTTQFVVQSSETSDSNVINAETCPASCLLPKQSGPCMMNLKRWYYKKSEQKCKLFTYGGCNGNSNRFGSKKSCIENCGLCRNKNTIQPIVPLESKLPTNPSKSPIHKDPIIPHGTRNNDNDDDVIYFPNPNGDGSLIPAYLYPRTPDIPYIPDLRKVHYYLYTRENPKNYDELFVDDSTGLKNSHFKRNKNVILMIHGFGGSYDNPFPWLDREAYLKIADMNVILVDWSELCKMPWYYDAVKNLYEMSKLNAKFLEFLLKENMITLDNIYLVGHSLGGQTVGITGNRFTTNTGLSIPRVTALDPALPLFAFAKDIDKVSPFSAIYVDVMHTNGGKLGVFEPRGHADFYPNGGSSQTGCGFDLFGTCAHTRATEYFLESIRGQIPFKGCKCKSWEEYDSGKCPCSETADMGHWVNKKANGLFYLRTNGQEPFAQG